MLWLSKQQQQDPREKKKNFLYSGEEEGKRRKHVSGRAVEINELDQGTQLKHIHLDQPQGCSRHAVDGTILCLVRDDRHLSPPSFDN